MNTGYKIGDVMTHHPVLVTVQTNLQECARTMRDNHVGSLLIMDGDRLAGIITEQDLVRKSMVNNDIPNERMAGDIMERHLLIASPEDDLFEAIKLMSQENIRHLPVVHNEELIGMITAKDILKVEPALFELFADRIELREHERKLKLLGEDHP